LVRRARLFFRYWVPVLVWMTLIFSGSTDVLSAGHTSRFIGPLLKWFKPDVSEETLARVQLVVRKGGHVTEYAVLAWLLWRAWRNSVRINPGPWCWTDAGAALGFAAAYACTDEIHQSFVPTRQGQFSDVLIDSCGAAIGLIIVWAIGRWRKIW
jgi:VanZ family protein